MSVVKNLDVQTRGTSELLIVLLHAYTLDPSSLKDVRKIMEDIYPNADFLVPELPYKNFFSIAKPAEIIAELLVKIDSAWDNSKKNNQPGYKKILLVGHSIGSLYARKLYVCACGENKQAPFEPDLKKFLDEKKGESLEKERDWAQKVDKIILLAGMNRGWSISHHLSPMKAFAATIGLAFGRTLMLFGTPTPIIFTVRRGETFITQLRIQWLAMRRAKKLKETQLIPAWGWMRWSKKTEMKFGVVQLLGTIDDTVSPEDNIDLIAGSDFLYFDVPKSGHADVIKMDDSLAGKKRKEVFTRVLEKSLDELRREQVLPFDDTLVENPNVTDVVFVIHGIRDEGYWTHKIARKVISEGRKREPKRVIASETSTYGYFPMLSFLWPKRRQEKVEWLMDQYAEALAKYPNAENFYYIGHSNGTYLAARALEMYPCCRFNRIVFAGSVVLKDYNWSRFMPSQVDAVANYIATADWVVALFPKALQTMHLQDLGSAGHDGFSDTKVLQLKNHNEKRYVAGTHSAALKEEVWESIADFILTGELNPTKDMEIEDKQFKPLAWISNIAPVVWIGIVFLVVKGALFFGELPIAEWQRTLLLVGYFLIIWTVLTRV
jgi:pimeloyl-ACP methyl ester carboxylesterase